MTVSNVIPGEANIGDEMTREISRRAALLVCAPAAFGMLAHPALAQQAASDTTQLEEVVVTAEKRESTVLNTPISLTALSGADIQARGATDLSTLLQSVPGVSIRSSGPGLTEFEMRASPRRAATRRRSDSITTTLP